MHWGKLERRIANCSLWTEFKTMTKQRLGVTIYIRINGSEFLKIVAKLIVSISKGRISSSFRL